MEREACPFRFWAVRLARRAGAASPRWWLLACGGGAETTMADDGKKGRRRLVWQRAQTKAVDTADEVTPASLLVGHACERAGNDGAARILGGVGGK